MERLNYDRITAMSDSECRLFLGIGKDRLLVLIGLLEKAYQHQCPQKGKPLTLDICERLSVLLLYYKNCCTMEGLAIDYGVSCSTICKAIHWTERALLRALEPSKNTTHEATPSRVLYSYL